MDCVLYFSFRSSLSFIKKIGDYRMKRGELTTQQLVILIILIISFVIILFFLFKMNLGGTTDKELCHNSVVMRGNSILPKETLPLNCHTKYLCISSDGTCEKMTNPEIKKVKTQDEVYQILADEMADCWWTFGEGKINYVGDDLFQHNYCSLCSQVSFDDSLKKSLFVDGSFSQKNLYDYLEKEKIPEKEFTYLEYLYGLDNLSKIHKGGFEKIDLNSQYLIIMGISSDVSKLSWLATGAVAAGTGIAIITFAPAAVPIIGALSVSSITGVFLTGVGGGAGYLMGVGIEGLSKNYYLPPTIIKVDSDEFKSLNCDSIKTLA